MNLRNAIKSSFLMFAILMLTIAAPSRLSAAGFGKIIRPSHPFIRYTGRFDRSDPNNVRFDWPGSTIELKSGGPGCELLIKGDGGLYNVYINGEMSVRRFDTLEQRHTFWTRLVFDTINGAAHYTGVDTVHLRITKRFEGRRGHVAELRKIFIADGCTLYPLPPRPRRRIEFIGGSNLIGFGAEANTLKCADPSLHSNSELAFGAVAAKILDAEYHIVAMSGKGLVRNWQSPFIASPRPFGDYYKRALRGDPASRWDFSTWTPHVAVMYFGTNDFSTAPYPTKELYKATYRNFISELQSRHPKTHVICVTSSREPVRTYVEELVVSMKIGGNDRVHFYSFGTIPTNQLGCDWHPGAEAQKKIGEKLADIIRPLLPTL